MKTFIDQLRACPIEKLTMMIQSEEASIEIIKRDLETMREVLKERTGEVVQKG